MAPGVALLFATALALVGANTPWSDDYAALWQASLGGAPLTLWINDGLMTVFFLVVGLEIRREMFEGELSTLRRAAVPLAVGLGGMLVPATIYVVLNHGRAGSAGWAIPMATDIAFAVGVLSLLGARVQNAQRILLLALAVIDDIGAIIVIAVFYAGGIELAGLAIAAAGLAGVLGLRAAGLRQPLLYLVPGSVIWFGLYRAGIHPALAGVGLGLLAPIAIVERSIRTLNPWVAFGVMPVFALANAGVALGGADLSGDALWIFLGIVVGLVVGKPIGIVAAALLSRQPRGSGVLLVGLVGGIGFTMSVFIANLAFPAGPLLAAAKLAILVGSAIAMVAGLGCGLAFRTGTRP